MRIVIWITAFFSWMGAAAQQVPNGNFESWTQGSSGLAADGWSTLTGGIVRSDMPGGGYGIHMQTVANNSPSQISCNFAYNHQPATFRFLGGFRKKADGDKAQFTVLLFRSIAGIRDTISMNIFTWNENTASGNTMLLVNKTFDLSYQSGATPDSCEIIVTSAVSDSLIHPGTILAIDDVYLRDWVAGAPDPVTLNTGIYPNPMSNEAMLLLNLPHASAVELILSAITGLESRTLFSGTLPAGETKIPFEANAAAGMYLLTVRVGQLTQSLKLVITGN